MAVVDQKYHYDSEHSDVPKYIVFVGTVIVMIVHIQVYPNV